MPATPPGTLRNRARMGPPIDWACLEGWQRHVGMPKLPRLIQSILAVIPVKNEVAMIHMRDAMRAVLSHRRGDVVLATETSVGAWSDVSTDVTLDLAVPAMSKGSSIALGVALAQPERRVILWDGDGSLLMNLGSIITVAGKGPANFYHIVVDNGVYAMTGGQPVPNAGNLDFQGLAKAAGYARTFEFDDLEDWTSEIGGVLEQDGPVLVVMKTVPELTDWKVNPPPPERPLREAGRMAHQAMASEA